MAGELGCGKRRAVQGITTWRVGRKAYSRIISLVQKWFQGDLGLLFHCTYQNVALAVGLPSPFTIFQHKLLKQTQLHRKSVIQTIYSRKRVWGRGCVWSEGAPPRPGRCEWALGW